MNEIEVSAFDKCVYAAIAAYAWDEPECWPSQQLVASDVGCARVSVNRSVQRLIAAGWLRIKDRRQSGRWVHNVYELFAAFSVGIGTIERIVKRARRRVFRANQRPGYTNHRFLAPSADQRRFGNHRTPGDGGHAQAVVPSPGLSTKSLSNWKIVARAIRCAA